jgi:hypothetical protein
MPRAFAIRQACTEERTVPNRARGTEAGSKAGNRATVVVCLIHKLSEAEADRPWAML